MNPTSEKLLLIVSRIREVSPRILVCELRKKNGDQLPLAAAGSHLIIPITHSNRKSELRQYSICSNPNQRDFYEIAVLCEPEAVCEPRALCEIETSYETGDIGDAQLKADSFTIGTQFECDFPANNFHVHADSSPAILIAGGIGIAPIITIAHTLAARGRRFSLHYVSRNKIEMAFTHELQNTFARQIHFYYEDEGHHIDMMQLLAEAPGNTLFYACGQNTMLEELERCARIIGITQDRIQQEHLATEKLPEDRAVVLELAYSGKLVNVNSNQPLLAALRDAKIPVKFDCCVGDCGTCAVKILEGEAEHRDHILSDAQKADGFICICVSRSKSEKLILAL